LITLFWNRGDGDESRENTSSVNIPDYSTIESSNKIIQQHLYITIQQYLSNTARIKSFQKLSEKYSSVLEFLGCFHPSLLRSPSCIDSISALLLQQLYSELSSTYSFRMNIHSLVLMPMKIKRNSCYSSIKQAASAIFRNYIACSIIPLKKHSSNEFDYATFLSTTGLSKLLLTSTILLHSSVEHLYSTIAWTDTYTIQQSPPIELGSIEKSVRMIFNNKRCSHLLSITSEFVHPTGKILRDYIWNICSRMTSHEIDSLNQTRFRMTSHEIDWLNYFIFEWHLMR
jgi:hypothetical protein